MKSSVTKEDNVAVNNSKEDADHGSRGFFSAVHGIPKEIWAISFFGLFLGMSSTMVYSQIGLFLKNDLGLSLSEIANLDGLVECASFVTRVFSGPISDFFRERKLILCIGCFVTLGSRAFLPIVSGFPGILSVQLSERIGNGLQASPRDALIADITPRSIRGRVYGLTKSIKTLGGFIGGLFAIWLMSHYLNDFRKVFTFAIIPVIFASVCLIFVKNTKREGEVKREKKENPFKRKYLKSLDFSFWRLVLLALVFQLSHFTEHMFPIYMSNFANTRVSGSVSLVITMGQILLAFTIGALADKFGKGKFIRVCMTLMVIANLFFLLAGHSSGFFNFSVDLSKVFGFLGEGFIINAQACCVYMGAFLWGGQMSAIDGLFLAIICEQVVFHLRATAIGIYSLILGGGYWIASKIAAAVWSAEGFGCDYAFACSITFCVLSFILSFVLLPKKYNVSLVKKESIA